ncbi:MAG: hypothetical protein WC797_01560, partial [Candidatus Paceibacterota bacterium]
MNHMGFIVKYRRGESLVYSFMETIKLSAKISRLFIAAVFVFALPFFVSADLSCQSVQEGDSDDVLQAKLQQCEIEIKEQKDLLANKERESGNLERDLSILDYKINQSKLEIKARDLNIANLDREIDKKSENIVNLSDKIEEMKLSVAELLRRTNELEESSIVEVLFS